MPIIFTVLTRYPQLRKWSSPLGLLLTVVSIVSSAFTNDVGPLIATQGVLYAIGCALIFSPTSLYLDDWFVEKKGLAYSVMWASKSVVGTVMPFFASALLDRWGLRTTLLVWAGLSVILSLPLLFLLKPRTVAAAGGNSNSGGIWGDLSFSFMRHGLFWMLQFGNIVQSLGYLMPSTYLASYATSIGLSDITGPILLAVFSVASVPGALFIGLLGDRISATSVILISSIGSAMAVFFLWGFSVHIGALVAFSVA